jgi:hypothetical protein
MTEAQARAAYDGATITMADANWSVHVDGLEAFQASTVYRLYCHFRSGEHTINGIEIYGRVPAKWPPAQVLKTLQDATEHVRLRDNTVLVGYRAGESHRVSVVV